MTVSTSIKISSLVCLMVASSAWAAIPLSGPCDPDFGPAGSCQGTTKESKSQGPRAAKPAAGIQGSPQPSAPAAPVSKSSAAKPDTRPEPASTATATDEPGTRHQAVDAPETLAPLTPPTQRTQ